MQKLWWNKQYWLLLIAALFLSASASLFANTPNADESLSIDRVELVTRQIDLLKTRTHEAQHELAILQQQHDVQITQPLLDKASKNLLDKASLDISVAKSTLDSIKVELADAEQTINWLDKNVQEIDNQLNVLGIFGAKAVNAEMINVQELKTDLTYQKKLLTLEKNRVQALQNLHGISSDILALRKDQYNQINTILKSRRMLHIKQEQVRDELVYQQQQNLLLQQVNGLYARLNKIDPIKAKDVYAALEREIFYTNERASYAYTQSLIARYKDQIQQMKLAVLRSNSISLLNEMSDQVQTLSKQMDRLDNVLKTRTIIMDKHIVFQSQKKLDVPGVRLYVSNLMLLKKQYQAASDTLAKQADELVAFRVTLDQAIQTELSSRQGFPTFRLKTIVDLGREMLLVPALTYQVVKSFPVYLSRGIERTSLWAWSLFAVCQFVYLFSFLIARQILSHWVSRPIEMRDRISARWLALQALQRNFLDVAVIANIIGILHFFAVPLQSCNFIVSLSIVWLIFKGIITVAQLILVETTHDTTGHDVKLYHRLKWIILAGALITGLTVFVHQLPLIYEFKTLCDRLFLSILLIVSLLLLRSWEVVPNLIISHIDSQHPYFHRSVKFIGILVPMLMLANSVIGLIGFLNLVMTVCWYEGIFLLVLIGYLIIRGFLTDATETFSRFLIQNTNNGWLWTEAFLKPFDRVLRIALFFISTAALLLLYGVDKQSPIIERFTKLMHYQLAHVLNTSITPLSIAKLMLAISVFYWLAKWTREFVFRLLSARTKDMGIRNSIAILSQYTVILVAIFLCLRVLGIDLTALAAVAAAFAFGIGMGLRDLANNFVSGFLILLERPLRVGDIVSINNIEGEVTNIGSRAITVRTWDCMEYVVPNAEIFNKSFTNWTAKDNVVRTISHIKISRYDNPNEVKKIINDVLNAHKDILKEPHHETYLKEMNDTLMDFELRYYVNIRQVKSRVGVTSSVLMNIWEAFAKAGIKPPYPQQEIFIRNGDLPALELLQGK